MRRAVANRKTRSLRILVERSGGRDLLASDDCGPRCRARSRDAARSDMLPGANHRHHARGRTAHGAGRGVVPEPHVVIRAGASLESNANLELEPDLDAKIEIESGPLASRPSSMTIDLPEIDLEFEPGTELSTGAGFAADPVTGGGIEFTTGGAGFVRDGAAFVVGDGVDSPADSELGTWMTGVPQSAAPPAPGMPPKAKASYWAEHRPLDAIPPVDPAARADQDFLRGPRQDLGGELPEVEAPCRRVRCRLDSGHRMG